MEGPGKGGLEAGVVPAQHGPYHEANTEGLKLLVSWAASACSSPGRNLPGSSSNLSLILQESCPQTIWFPQPALEVASLQNPLPHLHSGFEKGLRGHI